MLKVGDIIKGIKNDKNEFFNGLLKAQVVEVINNDYVLIQVSEHANPNYINKSLTLDNDSYLIEIINSELKLEDVNSFISNFIEDEIEKAKNDLKNLLEEKEYVRKNLVKIINDIESKRLTIKSLKHSSLVEDESSQKILEELKLIQKDEKCEGVYIDTNEQQIKIFTTQLYIEDENHPEGRFKINKYKISINLNDFTVGVFGLLDKYNRESCWSSHCPHPHISHNGRACWGNTEAMIVDSIERKELYTTFMLVINFLETFNIEDSAGVNIMNWDFVSKEDDTKILYNPYKDYINEDDEEDDDGDYYYEEEVSGFPEIDSDDIPF